MSDDQDKAAEIEDGSPAQVTDVAQHEHNLVKPPLGEGGQGRVYRTDDPEVLVKFVCRDGEILQDETEYKRYGSRFARLLELPLSGINVAAPETLLSSPWCGYSMRLLRDMVPIKKLLLPHDCDLAKEYPKTGGTRRRLAALAGLANVMSRLHTIPAAYGDVSPENIFISEAVDRASVWLIDVDNMHVLSREGAGCYTPGYAAPELATKGHSNSRSDVFGFACLAYNILCQHEAFHRGDAPSEEDAWDCSTVASKEAPPDEAWLAAGVPWVHDEDDPGEALGVPWELVCSPLMRKSFHATLGAGRLDPDQRPTMRHWQGVLTQAHDLLVRCQNSDCQWDFFLNQSTCPVCGAARPAMLRWESRIWHPALDAGYDDPGLALATDVGKKAMGDYLKDGNRDPVQLQPPVPPTGRFVQQLTDGGPHTEVMTRHCTTLCERDIDQPELRVQQVGNRLRLDAVGSRFDFFIADQTGHHRRIVGSEDCPLPTSGSQRWWLHTGRIDTMHRVLFPVWDHSADSRGEA